MRTYRLSRTNQSLGPRFVNPFPKLDVAGSTPVARFSERPGPVGAILRNLRIVAAEATGRRAAALAYSPAIPRAP